MNNFNEKNTNQKNWGKISADSSEERFLHGPRPRRFEFLTLLKILLEFIKGFRKLHFIGPCVTVFGSARINQDSPYYTQAREIGAKLGQLGFTVMTGGGPGIMEAANRGAKDVAAKSIGCNIKLPKEQHPNPYLDLWLDFDHFFIRKTMLLKYSYAFIGSPGGYGTMDEIFEVCTLIQTGKIKNFPVILIGIDFWRPLIAFIEDKLLAEKMIDRKDRDVIFLTDSVDEAIEYLKRKVLGSEFGLKYSPKPKRCWIFGE